MDWFAVALREVAGDIPDEKFDLDEVAKKIGVSRGTLYNWDRDGLAKANFGAIVKLSELSDIPLDDLKKRLGPLVNPQFVKLERRIRKQ